MLIGVVVAETPEIDDALEERAGEREDLAVWKDVVERFEEEGFGVRGFGGELELL